jgi:hypothetical protein
MTIFILADHYRQYHRVHDTGDNGQPLGIGYIGGIVLCVSLILLIWALYLFTHKNIFGSDLKKSQSVAVFCIENYANFD